MDSVHFVDSNLMELIIYIAISSVVGTLVVAHIFRRKDIMNISAITAFMYTMGTLSVALFAGMIIHAAPFGAGGIDSLSATLLLSSVIAGLGWGVALLFHLNEGVKQAHMKAFARRQGRQ